MGRKKITLPELGEAFRETGFGTVTGVEGDQDDRSARLVMDVKGMAKPVGGWFDPSDGELWAFCHRAKAEGWRVRYTIDVRRHREVDTSIPITDLTTDQRARDLVVLDRVDGDGNRLEGVGVAPAPVGQNGATAAPARPEPQPEQEAKPEAAPTARGRAPAKGEWPCDQCDTFPFSSVSELVGHYTTTHMGQTAQPPAGRANGNGTRHEESHAMTAAVGMWSLAYELWVQRAHAQWAEDFMRKREEGEDPPPAKPGPLDMEHVGKLAGTLLGMADAIQQGLSKGDIDRNRFSHTRARGVLRTVLDSNPLPWDGSREDKQAWMEAVVGDGVALLRGALAMIEPRGA